MKNVEIFRVVGRNIRAVRLAGGLTQECLGELAGVHWKTIGCIERGVFSCSFVTFARIAQHLDISPNRLLDGLPAPDPKRPVRIKKALARKRAPRKL